MSDAAARINRLLRKWTVGERAIAVMPIFYAVHDLEVPVSTVGVVEQLGDSAVLHIRWESRPEIAVATSPDCVDQWTEANA